MKSKFIYGIVLLGIMAGFVSCTRKGENDPLLSLRSRKARVVGEWKVTSSEGADTADWGGGQVNYSNWAFNGETVNQYDAGNLYNTYLLQTEYSFRKDGTYDYYSKATHSGSNAHIREITETGTWNFTSGVGENSKKEMIVLQALTGEYKTITDSLTEVDNVTYSGSDRPSVTYLIDELRHKTIVFKKRFTMTENANQTTTKSSAEYVLEPR